MHHKFTLSEKHTPANLTFEIFGSMMFTQDMLPQAFPVCIFKTTYLTRILGAKVNSFYMHSKASHNIEAFIAHDTSKFPLILMDAFLVVF